MRPVVFVSLFAIAAMAIPIAHEIFGTKHLTKRNSNAGPTIDFLLATLLTFGGFVWGRHHYQEGNQLLLQQKGIV